MIDVSISLSARTLREHKGALRIWDAQRRPTSQIHRAVDAHGMPVRMLITASPVAEGSRACRRIEGTDAGYLLADKGDESDALGLPPNTPE